MSQATSLGCIKNFSQSQAMLFQSFCINYQNKYLAIFRSLLTLAKLLLMSQKWYLYEKNEIFLDSYGVFISKFVGRYPLLVMTVKKTDCSHSLSKWQPGRSATEANLSSHRLRLCVYLQETQPTGERNSMPFVSFMFFCVKQPSFSALQGGARCMQLTLNKR